MMLIQRDLHRSLRERSLASSSRIATLARPCTPDQLAQRAGPTRWSGGEVIEHLCVSDELYERPLLALVAGARPDAAAPLRPWTPTLAGRLLAHLLGNPRPLKAPRKFQPGPTQRNGVVESFLQKQDAFVALMDRAEGLDWRRLKMASPALSNIRLNHGDVFAIHVVHVERHAHQLERALQGVA